MARMVLFALWAILPAAAQNFTTVTATVVDPNSLPYANGTVIFQLVNGSGAAQFATPPTLPTSPPTAVTATVGPVGLDSNGVLNATLPSNAQISPASTQWIPSVCINPEPPPFGSGKGGCFTAAAITVSGTSQDISATLNAAALPLTKKDDVGRLYNTLPAAGTSSISPITMVTAPAIPVTGTSYRFSSYGSVTVAGTSCTTNSTVAVAVTYQDPNEGSPAATAVFTFTVVNNGSVGRLIPALTNPLPAFRAAAGTAVQYSTTYTAGANCAPAPTVQVYPILEQM